MKLYHYAPKENTVMSQGLLSVCKAPKDLKTYAIRAGSENCEEIMAWLEQTFEGRSRSISCLTEPIKWQGNDDVLKKIVDGSILFSFELEDLIKDGLIEAIWRKKGSAAHGYEENFLKVSIKEIETSPIAWEKVDASKGLLYGVIPHYLLVLKNGCIPPKYLKKKCLK